MITQIIKNFFIKYWKHLIIISSAIIIFATATILLYTQFYKQRNIPDTFIKYEKTKINQEKKHISKINENTKLEIINIDKEIKELENENQNHNNYDIERILHKYRKYK